MAGKQSVERTVVKFTLLSAILYKRVMKESLSDSLYSLRKIFDHHNNDPTSPNTPRFESA